MVMEFLSQGSAELNSEACAWLAQLETGELSPEDLVAFREWINRSPRHYEELRRLAYLSQDINVLAHMANPLAEAASRSRPVVKSRHRIFGDYGAIAVSAAALVLILACVALFARFGTSHDPFIVATNVGEMKRSKLSDGSIIQLNTDSQVEVLFDNKQRRVRLLKGEAFFQVAHNSLRPFIVYASDRTVRAVGTAFAVRWTDDELSVTVAEGRVEFQKASDPVKDTEAGSDDVGDQSQKLKSSSPSSPIILVAGRRLALSNIHHRQVVEALSKRAMVRELSWQSGLLDFGGMPLGEVIREWKRYSDLDIEIEDSELVALKFDGIFRTSEIGSFFEALHRSFGIEAEYVGPKQVRLFRSPQKSSG